MSERSCGACQACCHAKRIPVVPSPAWSDCPHQGEAGCGIYAERPRGCAAYTCAWVDGWGREREDRPDRLGLLFELAPGPVGGLEVRALELRAGALDSADGQARVASWSARGVVVDVVRCGASP